MSDRMRQGREGRTGRWSAWRLLPLLPLFVACAAGERLVTIPGQGYVAGLVYFDRDGDSVPGGPDEALQGVGVRLVIAETIDTLARATSDANGAFVFGAVPVGRYTIAVPSAPVFGDSLQVVRIDTADVSLAVSDTSQVNVSVSFPSYTVAEARARPLGEKIFVLGLALNSSPAFGDSTVHLADTSGTMRVTGARGELVAAGDSVRVLGETGARDGQPVLADGQVWLIGIGGPVETSVTTLDASTAGGGVLDAALVKVDSATISDTATVDGDYIATVDDGSGPVRIVFDEDLRFTDMRTLYVPAAAIDATGVLVPDGLGAWRLKPRGDSDLVVR